MKIPTSRSELLARIRNRLAASAGAKPTYGELEERILSLESRLASRNFAAGLIWETEEMFRAAFLENPDAVALIRRKDGVLLDVNPGFTSLLQYDPAQVVGKTADDLKTWVSPKDRKNFMSQLAQNGQVIALEARFRALDGDVVHGLISAWPIDIHGEPCLLSITRDLTERKRAEEMLGIQRDLGIELSEARDLKQAADHILKASFKVHGIDCGGVYIVDGLSGGMNMVTHAGLPRSFISKVNHYPADSPQARLVAQGKPSYGLFEEMAAPGSPEPGGLKALAVIPVEYEGNIVASINLGSHTQDRFPESARNAIESIAARMGGVIARLEAEAALAESEERFSTFMDLLPGMAFMKDENGHFLYVNSHMSERFGRKKWIGGSMHKLFDKKTADRLVEEDARALSGETLESVGPIPDKDGVEHVYRTFKFPVVREGKPVMLGGIGLDITREVAAQKALQTALQKLRAVFNTFPGGVHVVDRDFTVLDISDRLVELHRLPNREAAIGKKCYKVYHNRKSPCPVCTMPAALATQRLVTRIMAADEIDTGGATYKVYTHPIKDDAGLVWGALECMMDVSDIKAAEQKLLIALHEKEMLLKEVHHRVKNNMQVISALLTLQAAKLRDENVSRAFKDCQNRIKAMALVHETLYKAENLAKISLAQYVSILGQSLFADYGAHEKKISLAVEADGITLAVDQAVPCGMIINEILTNSLKHAFPSGGPGEIRFSARIIGGKTLEMIISDNGVGIPEDYDAASSQSLGVGLVEGLVKNQLLGTLETKTGPGTRFKIHFPAPQG